VLPAAPLLIAGTPPCYADLSKNGRNQYTELLMSFVTEIDHIRVALARLEQLRLPPEQRLATTRTVTICSAEPIEQRDRRVDADVFAATKYCCLCSAVLVGAGERSAHTFTSNRCYLR
jgi:hypothetical protein